MSAGAGLRTWTGTPTASTPWCRVIEGERPYCYSRHLADDGRHVADPAVRFAGISVGIVNAALVVIFTVAQQNTRLFGSPGFPLAS